jgi:ADP-L-glycero-D-manno-heptose 6-epimerase
MNVIITKKVLMIILTGSSGFIGKNFLKHLREPVIEVEKEDCYKFLSTFNKWNEVSLILHQGAISSTTERDIFTLHHHNVAFTLQLFQKAIEYQIPVKFASSASVYGNTQGQINPLNYYAITKLQIDYFIQDNLDKFSHISSYRYYNVYGPEEDHKEDQASPIFKFTKQIRETGKLKLFENSHQFLRDFVCVNDIVNVVLNNDKPSGIYDLGTSNPMSFQQVAELIIQKEGGEIEYIPFPEHLQGKYQTYTCAKKEFDYSFKSVADYLEV